LEITLPALIHIGSLINFLGRQEEEKHIYYSFVLCQFQIYNVINAKAVNIICKLYCYVNINKYILLIQTDVSTMYIIKTTLGKYKISATSELNIICHIPCIYKIYPGMRLDANIDSNTESSTYRLQ
jgi:hypothetical protein